jgi:hypothetical protein
MKAQFDLASIAHLAQPWVEVVLNILEESYCIADIVT